jgi:tetratricopeptide (TPR) repeat protein
VLLCGRGDHDGAAAAFERAWTGRGGRELGRAGAALIALGDIDGAAVAWGKAAELGDGDAAFALGKLRSDLNDVDGAEAAWRKADEQGHAEAALRLGRLLGGRYDDTEAQAAFARAVERGNDDAAAEADLLRRGARHIARAQQQRTDQSMTLSPKAAQAMADALAARPAWLKLLEAVSPRRGQATAFEHARRAAEEADPDGILETGDSVDPYPVRNVAVFYARVAREDITAVRRIRAQAADDATALRRAEQLVRSNDPTRKSRIVDRAARLIVAALNNEPPKPASPEDNARFETARQRR